MSSSLTPYRTLLVACAACAASAPVIAASPVAAGPCESDWSDQFASGELHGFLTGIGVFDAGTGPSLFVGGYMSSSSPHSDGMLRMTDTGWAPVGGGGLPSGLVRAFTPFDDGTGLVLAVGGSFQAAGGIQTEGVAFWDGETWSSPAGGLGGTNWVESMAVFDDDGAGPALFVAGFFTLAGGVSVGNIAKWNGEAWSDVGGGLTSSEVAIVYSVAAFEDGSGPALYAAGRFTEAGGVAVANIARWNGLGWSALGAGIDDSARALTVFDDGTGPGLYVAGNFLAAGSRPANRIARWDGEAWSPLGSGLDGLVEDLAVFDDGSGPALYATGDFAFAGGILADGIARWDGASWSSVGEGARSANALAVFDAGSGPALYAAGSNNFVFSWDGSEWRRHGGGVGRIDSGEVQAMRSVEAGAGVEPGVYVGGWFPFAGDVDTSNIARFDGAQWNALGDGLDCSVRAIELFDDGSANGEVLFVGTGTSSGCDSSGLFRWDGTSWTNVSAGAAAVWRLISFDDGMGPALYAYGSLPGGHFGRWIDGTWTLVADIVGSILDMAVYDDGTGAALYVAGGISSVDGAEVSGIARFDGSSWSDVGGGADLDNGRTIRALAVYDDGRGPALYAGGTFATVGGVVVNSVARWDGHSWSSVGDGVLGWVASLATVSETGGTTALYAGGFFDVAGGTSASMIARWNGTFWSPLDTGTDTRVSVLASLDTGRGTALFAGGEFSTAGGVGSNNFASWTVCPEFDVPPYLPCRYEVTIIEGPDGLRSDGLGLNEQGDVVGSLGWIGMRAFLWTADDGLMPLGIGTLSGDYLTVDVNESRQIAAVVTSGSMGSRGLLYDSGQWTILEPIPGDHGSWARAMSNDGTVVGSSSYVAVSWHEGTLELIDLPGGGDPRDITDDGVIVGGFFVAGQESGFILQPGGELTIIPPIPGGFSSGARAVNDAGIVVGHGSIPNPDNPDSPVGLGRGFVWDHGRFTVLEPLAGHNQTTAADVNSDGVVVGVSAWTGGGPPVHVAVAWHNGVPTILNDVVPWDLELSIESARAINDQGQIVGKATSWRGTTAVLLTPVQQPVGDIDGDCRVDTNDLLILLFEWGANDSPADLDGDGAVGIRDFLILLGHWT